MRALGLRRRLGEKVFRLIPSLCRLCLTEGEVEVVGVVVVVGLRCLDCADVFSKGDCWTLLPRHGCLRRKMLGSRECWGLRARFARQ